MSLYNLFKVAALPMDIAIGDKKANIEYLRVAMKTMPSGTDLVALPELFSTGYIDDKDTAATLAEPNDGETIDMIKRLAADYHCAISGSFLACDGEALYNRGFFCEPQGDVTYYDKRHLFNLSKEAQVVSHGAEAIPVIRFRGWNIALAICYDVRFPVWCRNTNNKYDLLVIPANWPEKRAFAWSHLLQARAIENQAYVVGANRSGTDAYGTYDNLTYIFDFMGKSEGSDLGQFVTASLSKTHLNSYRRSFPVIADADSFTIS